MIITHSTVDMYADDTILSPADKHLTEIETELQRDLFDVSQRCKNRNM